MKHSKHIERVFQEGLNDFQASPSSKVWKNIEHKLNQKQQHRNLIPLWWKAGSIAAILVLFFSIGILYQNNKENARKNKQAAFTDAADSNTIQFRPTSYQFSSVHFQLIKFENDIQEAFSFEFNANTNSSSAPDDRIPTNKANDRQPAFLASQIQKAQHTKLFKGSFITGTLSSDSKLSTSSSKKSLFDDINNQNAKIALEDNKSEDKPWTLQPHVGPVFMNSLSSGNPIEPNLKGKTSSSPNVSFGINMSYAINKNIKIRTGINQVAMGYNTQDVILSQTPLASRQDIAAVNSDRNPNLSTNVRLLSANSGTVLDQSRSSSAFSSVDFSSAGILNHEMVFLEVPLEVEYVVIDKRIGLHILGGASTFLLNDNSLSFQENGVSRNIGRAQNMNDFSLSANLGVGLDYNFSKILSFNLEPKFRYQLNTFQANSSGFQPYFFGIYSGLKIKF